MGKISWNCLEQFKDAIIAGTMKSVILTVVKCFICHLNTATFNYCDMIQCFKGFVMKILLLLVIAPFLIVDDVGSKSSSSHVNCFN